MRPGASSSIPGQRTIRVPSQRSSPGHRKSETGSQEIERAKADHSRGLAQAVGAAELMSSSSKSQRRYRGLTLGHLGPKGARRSERLRPVFPAVLIPSASNREWNHKLRKG